MPNNNKKRKCEVCEKWMRSDVLGRHMKIHKDLLTLPSDEMEEELKARHARKLVRLEKEEKRQKVIATASKLDVSIPPELQDCSFNEENEELPLHQRLLHNKKLYLERLRIGEEIANYMITDEIPEESLDRNDKECLVLFRSQHVRLNIDEVELRPWQKEAFQLLEFPTERKVIWIYGSQGNVGKSWFQNYVEAE